jgi:hypothetical protein
MIFFFFFSQGFHHHINLQISRDTLIKSNLIPHRPYASVHVKNQSNKWSLSNPTHESNTGISNDMQCSNKLNIPMTCNPQLWCNSCSIKNIAILFFILAQTNTNNQIKWQKCLPPKLKWHIVLNVSINTIPRELCKSGIKQENAPPKLEWQTLDLKNTTTKTYKRTKIK